LCKISILLSAAALNSQDTANKFKLIFLKKTHSISLLHLLRLLSLFYVGSLHCMHCVFSEVLKKRINQKTRKRITKKKKLNQEKKLTNPFKN
jgi:hypothetical protein